MEVYGYDLEELKAQYEDVQVCSNGSFSLVRITGVDLPKGCKPPSSAVLLLLKPGQPKPEIYVRPGIKLPNGKDPRSTSTVTIEGESWLQFSYQFEYNKDTHSLVQFIESSLRRFAKNE